jgi:hypothetical protein
LRPAAAHVNPLVVCSNYNDQLKDQLFPALLHAVVVNPAILEVETVLVLVLALVHHPDIFGVWTPVSFEDQCVSILLVQIVYQGNSDFTLSQNCVSFKHRVPSIPIGNRHAVGRDNRDFF